MKKRFLATLLTLVMALAMTAPALAESVTEGWDTAPLKTVFSDVVSQETVKGDGLGMADRRDAMPLYTVKVGTTVSVAGSEGYKDITFYPAHVDDDGKYVTEKDQKERAFTVEDGTPYTLKDSDIGLWSAPIGNDIGNRGYYMNVIANDEKPAEPEKPVEPSKPTEPEKPAEPEKPTEPTKPAEPTKPTETEKPTEPTKPAEPTVAGTCTAKKYDTWGQIALNNYGTYSKAMWSALKAANKGVALKEGATINLPEKIGKYTLLPAQVLAEGETLYTVKAGDTLGQIAVNTYKDINMYKAIFERNSDRLANANSIYEGQVIVLPAKPAK